MSINGIGVGYSAWQETEKVQKNGSRTGFANKMAGADMAGSVLPQRAGVRVTGQNSALEAYRASAASTVRNVKPAYETYESENYRIVPDNEVGCFDIYNKQGERIGAFEYSDIKVRQDSTTGKQFLISEHGTMNYDAMVMDGELKDDLQNVMGVETLETEELQGFTLRTHYGIGIQYLVRAGEEGRGGKVLLQSQTDIKKYEALAETYFNKYPNLIHDKNSAYIWADLEIKGLAQRADNGIIAMGFDGMSYNDNENCKNNWSVRFSEDIYKAIFGWLHNNGELEQAGSQESETTTEIIVKPDGSRVLMMTMSIGGMETTMSLEISKPTEAPNEYSQHDTDNNMSSDDTKMDAGSDEMK